jgi:maleylacetate reductase
MGLHHKLCHVLGGTFDLPHAATHAVLIPHVASYMLAREPEATAVLTRALGDNPVTALHELAECTGVPRTLGELGIEEVDLATVIDQTVTAISVPPDELRALLLDALRGVSTNHTTGSG